MLYLVDKRSLKLEILYLSHVILLHAPMDQELKGSIKEGNILGNSFQFQSDICHQKVKDVFCVTLGLLSHIILSNPHKK